MCGKCRVVSHEIPRQTGARDLWEPAKSVLTHRDHPTGSSWTCGECSKSIKAGWSCDSCHNILCADCAPKTHRVPAGAEVGKICLLITELPLALSA